MAGIKMDSTAMYSQSVRTFNPTVCESHNGVSVLIKSSKISDEDKNNFSTVTLPMCMKANKILILNCYCVSINVLYGQIHREQREQIS